MSDRSWTPSSGSAAAFTSSIARTAFQAARFQSPPAASAITSNVRQFIRARLCSPGSISGAALANASALSIAHRKSCDRSRARCSLSMCSKSSACSLGRFRRIAIIKQRLSVAGGSLRPIIPIAFGQNVLYGRGSWVSGSQRMMQSPRVQPLLTTSLRSSLLTKAVSASSIEIVGAHFAIERKSAAPVIETLDNPLRTRKLISLSSVVLPLFGSGDVTNRTGLCTAICSCSHVSTTQSATTTAWSLVMMT